MKKILIPCDFSDTSESAVNYAIEMADHFGSELILLHVTQYPLMNPEVGLAGYTYQDAKEDSLKALKELAGKITNRNPRLNKIECLSEMGDTAEEVLKFSIEKQPDLVIMGISGHGSKLMKSIIGSSAVSVSKKIEVPLIIVPPNAKYKKISSIAYACDYNADLHNEISMKKVKAIASLFGANLHILHIVPEKNEIRYSESFTDNYMEHKLESSPHRTFLVTEKNASEGLLSFLKNNFVDMIIIEPKKHSLFHKLFYPSVTNEIAFNSPVPVMTIHTEPHK
jgi:nucleotide-binding universal stress UspA family protein